jgi:uncharacterized protein YkwD
MPRRLLPIAAVLCALAAAGCGSPAGNSGGDRAATKIGSSPRISPLQVTATDARLGDATQADSRNGIQELKVPSRIVDPAALRALEGQRNGVGAGAACENTDLIPDGGNLAVVTAATLCLLNGERADAALPPLVLNAKLAESALEHSQDMVSNQYFDHNSQDGRDVVDRIRATGYIPSDRQWTVGENLAWGTGTLGSPRNIVAAWMNSPGHRENILRAEYREIGFGVVHGNPRSRDSEGATYTTNFGSVNAPAAGTAGQQVAATTTVEIARKAAERRRAAARHRAAAARRRKAAAARRKAAARRASARRARARLRTT